MVLARFILLVVSLTVAWATPAAARTVASRFIPVGSASAMPRGFVELCQAQPRVCATLADGPSAASRRSAALSDTRNALDTRAPLGGDAPVLAPDDLDDAERMRLLKRVDAAINAHVRQQSDRALYGVGELWRPSGSGRDAAGDCEDLAIQKRLDLIAAGFAPARLFFAIVYRTDIGLHAVLVARLDNGDVVLDSRSNFIEPWSSTRYAWLVAEYPGNPMRWYMTG